MFWYRKRLSLYHLINVLVKEFIGFFSLVKFIIINYGCVLCFSCWFPLICPDDLIVIFLKTNFKTTNTSKKFNDPQGFILIILGFYCRVFHVAISPVAILSEDEYLIKIKLSTSKK